MFSFLAKNGVPQYCALLLYDGCISKNLRSCSSASLMVLFASTSFCPLLTTGTYPSFNMITRPARMSITSVPLSIRSTFVNTPIVLSPSGSTSLANFNPSELAKSVFAAVTARIIAFGRVIYFIIISRICRSISLGWSPTGTLVSPGKSTSVKVSTFGEYTHRFIGSGEIPAFFPVFISVSRTISRLISSKSYIFLPGI
ncbi:hypothetical protein AX774_g4397 [Zancudomyces culisetae]|uniref:Uncharacterized protein n=1 Tax=Zancudomyces culisetae TaxID=1213189 RepID=A0A1R1PMF0_ZANCU|nr:hypothetical protein AX774_g4397 [Zancudomyces culisetae]|eukprot:OMH82127.1 hypothetical protein AX774_g4397 [Zancudomyces culisetae]